jgi:hypothetical protein
VEPPVIVARNGVSLGRKITWTGVCLAAAVVAICGAGVVFAGQDAARARTPPADVREALAELNARFTVRGRPVHPGLIERFERWESDSAEPAVVSVDALAAAGSNEFPDDSVKKEDNGQVTIMKDDGRGFFGYVWLGSVAPGTQVVRAFANGGGSGIFETLFVLRASAGTGQGPDGAYSQLLISVVRVFPLGDRDDASVTVRPNRIIISKSRYRDKAVTLQVK